MNIRGSLRRTRFRAIDALLLAVVGAVVLAAPLSVRDAAWTAHLEFVPGLAVAGVLVGYLVERTRLPGVVGHLLALLLGFTAVACRTGEWIEDRFGWRGHSAVLATVLGLLLIVGPTMLSRMLGFAPFPGAFALLVSGLVFEYIMWTIGLGAALMTGFGRWSTSPPPVPPVAPSGVVAAIG